MKKTRLWLEDKRPWWSYMPIIGDFYYPNLEVKKEQLIEELKQKGLDKETIAKMEELPIKEDKKMIKKKEEIELEQQITLSQPPIIHLGMTFLGFGISIYLYLFWELNIIGKILMYFCFLGGVSGIWGYFNAKKIEKGK